MHYKVKFIQIYLQVNLYIIGTFHYEFCNYSVADTYSSIQSDSYEISSGVIRSFIISLRLYNR